MKNIYEGALLLVKLQAKVSNLLKVTLIHGCFSRFLSYTNDTKSHDASHIIPVFVGKPEEAVSIHISAVPVVRYFFFVFCF